MVHIHFRAPTMSVDLRLFQLTGCGGLDHSFCVHVSVRIPAGPTGFSGGGFVFKFDGLVFDGPLAAAFAYVMKTVIFPEGLVFAWLPAASCAALVARPASVEVWSCPLPVATPAACLSLVYVTGWWYNIVQVVFLIGALWEKGNFQCNIVLYEVFGCLHADGFGVPLNVANHGVPVDGLALQWPYPWLGSALSMTRPCPSPYCLQFTLASIFAGIENDLVQAVSPAPVFTKSFVPVDHVVSLTPKATLGVRLKVLGGPKVCVHKPHELSVSQCKVCEEGKEEGKGKETGKEKNGSFCIFVQTLCSKHEVLRVEAEILGNELLTLLSQKYGVAVERFYCTFQGKRLEESLQLRQMGIQRDSRLVMQGRILGGSTSGIDWVCPHCNKGGCWPTRKTCYRCGKHRDMPVVSTVPPVNTTEQTIQQQVKEYEKSLRDAVQKGAPSFSVPNRLANQGPNAWGQGKQQQPKVQGSVPPNGMAVDELVRILTMCGAGAEVLTKVQGHFSPPEPDVPLENKCAQLKTDIDREERNLVGLRDRLRQREEEVVTLRRNVDEKAELVGTLQQQLQEVKREMANPPHHLRTLIPWDLKVFLLLLQGS